MPYHLSAKSQFSPSHASQVDLESLFLRPIQENELEEMYCLVVQEGWNNLPFKKFKMLAEKFDNGVLVAVINKNTLVGCLSVIGTHKGQCILGNLVIDIRYRNKGLGKRIMSELQRIHGQQTVTLTAVEGTAEFYRKCRFHEVGEVHQIIYLEVSADEVRQKISRDKSVVIQSYNPDMFEELCQYDTHQRGYDMSTFLSVMIGVSDYLLIARSKANGNIVGYTVAFMLDTTLNVDGLFADDDETALLLYLDLLKNVSSPTEVRIQTLKPRLYLTTFGKILHEKCTTYTRMANGIVTPTSLEKLYAVTDCDYSA